MPELPEVEVTARLLDAAVRGATIESALAPGVNVLKTFDPALQSLEGSSITAVERRGKLILLRADAALTLVIHLMNAGRLQLFDKRASLRDRTSRLLLRLDGDRELRLREFGTRQAAWAKLYRDADLETDEHLRDLGPEAWPDPPLLGLSGPRPLHTVLRDQKVIAGIGRTWVDDILWHARLSPFKRGSDLTADEAATLREAIRAEFGRAVDHYAEHWQLPLPDKQAKVARIHAHQGEPCPRCATVLEAVFFEDYVMTYCPECQTGGRVLKDRRLSRLLK